MSKICLYSFPAVLIIALLVSTFILIGVVSLPGFRWGVQRLNRAGLCCPCRYWERMICLKLLRENELPAESIQWARLGVWYLCGTTRECIWPFMEKDYLLVERLWISMYSYSWYSSPFHRCLISQKCLYLWKATTYVLTCKTCSFSTDWCLTFHE